MNGNPKMNTSTYSRCLNPYELINWIRDMDKLFDMKQIEYPNRVKLDSMKLKGHASLWWDFVQFDRQRKHKDKIKTLDILLANMIIKLLTIYYTLYLYRKLENLRKNDIIIKDYT